MPKPKAKATTLEDVGSRLDDTYLLIEEQSDAVAELDSKLQAVVKSSSILGAAILKLSDNMLKVGAGNVNAQHLRDLIFKRLNVKTGWQKAEVKSMISSIIGTLIGK